MAGFFIVVIVLEIKKVVKEIIFGTIKKVL